MLKIRAVAAGASRACRKLLPSRSAAAAALASAGQRTRAAFVWVEDHAEPLILATLAVLIAAVVMLLLWKTARVISLAREFEPVLQAIAALTAILLGVLRGLKWHRDRREKKEAATRPQPPLPGTS